MKEGDRVSIPADSNAACDVHLIGPYEVEAIAGGIARIACSNCNHWGFVSEDDLELWPEPDADNAVYICYCKITASMGCTCGAFEKEMHRKGYRKNKWTSIWEKRR